MEYLRDHPHTSHKDQKTYRLAGAEAVHDDTLPPWPPILAPDLRARRLEGNFTAET